MWDLSSLFSFSSIMNLINQLSQIDIAGQINAFYDTFGYSILLWVLNLGNII